MKMSLLGLEPESMVREPESSFKELGLVPEDMV